MTDFVTHHRDHASVLLDGDLDWPKVHDLVHAIETAVEFYLYGVVEIRVRSAGGSNEPLRHILERLRVMARAGRPDPDPRGGPDVERCGAPRRARG